MKFFKKSIFCLMSGLSFSAHAVIVPFTLLRAMGVTASRCFAIAQGVHRAATPTIKEQVVRLSQKESVKKAFGKADAYLTKAEAWALENPEAAAGAIGGGLIGYELSGDGFFNTAINTAGWAFGGAAFFGWRGALAAQRALATELNAAKIENQALAVEAQLAKINAQHMAAQLQELRRAATVCPSRSGNTIPVTATAQHHSPVGASHNSSPWSLFTSVAAIERARVVARAERFLEQFTLCPA